MQPEKTYPLNLITMLLHQWSTYTRFWNQVSIWMKMILPQSNLAKFRFVTAHECAVNKS